MFRAISILLLTAGAGWAGNFYSTSFPSTENPIAQSGSWTNGGTTGLDWHNIRTTGGTPGLAFGTQVESGSGFDDSVACLSNNTNGMGSWGVNQTVEITIHQVTGDGASFEEYEALLDWHISAHSISGYECNASIKGQYAQPVRWNGASGSFTYLIPAGGHSFNFSGTISDGDKLKWSRSGNIITFYRNGVSQDTVDITAVGGSVWTDGTPGVGVYISGGSSGNDADFGISNYAASDSGDPVITTQPVNQTANVGATATFTISAGGFTTLSYQWKFNGSNVGSNSSTYARTNCQLADSGGSVTCVVTDTAGNVTSSTATLTVNGGAALGLSVNGGILMNGTIRQ